MIKIKRTCKGDITTKAKGKGFDIVEELFHGMISVIGMLVKNECLKQEEIIGFIDDFTQQVKDAMATKQDK